MRQTACWCGAAFLRVSTRHDGDILQCAEGHIHGALRGYTPRVPDVVVTVSGGVAAVERQRTGLYISIVDYDNLNAGGGRGDDTCPCRDARDRCEVCLNEMAKGAKP